MDAKQLYEKLKPIQEARGYLFNADMSYTMPLLENLLVNKERYGYMSCPCRLAIGTFEEDRDIVCPCVYREPDVAEYGACFCALYVNKEWNEGKTEHKTVPERRPAEKVMKAMGLG